MLPRPQRAAKQACLKSKAAAIRRQLDDTHFLLCCYRTSMSRKKPPSLASENAGLVSPYHLHDAGVDAVDAPGTPLGTPPSGYSDVHFYLPPSTAVRFTVAGAQPTAAPVASFTAWQAAIRSNWGEALSACQQVYVLPGATDVPLSRWR